MFPTSQDKTGGFHISNRKAEQWTLNYKQHAFSADKIFSALCTDLDTGDVSTLQQVPGLKLVVLPDGAPPTQLALMFVGHCQALTKLLSSPLESEGPVRLPVGLTMHLVSRCLGVSYKNVTALPSLKEVAGVLPNVQQSVMGVLFSLIMCCQSNLLPQGKVILDLLLQMLSSAELMEVSQQSATRSCVYLVLSEWLKMAGLGAHSQSQFKVIVQKMMSDIEAKSSEQEVPEILASDQDGSKGSSKSKKKKKKRHADSYKDLSTVNNTNNNAEVKCSPHIAQATLSCLELTNTVLERGQFIQMQKLVGNLLEKASNLSRQGAPRCSPYSSPACRLRLYSSVWTCVHIPLENGATSPDVVQHFQATNRALSLLSQASHSDSSVEVRSYCHKLLAMVHSLGRMERPIVRKVLPSEDMELPDVSHTNKEVERMSEENESLRRRVLELEMENHEHSRRLAAMESLKRQETDRLEASNNNKKDGTDVDSPDEDESKEEDDDEVDNKKSDVSMRKMSSSEDDDDTEMMTTTEVVDRPGPSSSSKSASPEKKHVTSEPATDIHSANKKPRMEDPQEGGEGIQDMLLDFVDADPDH